MRTLKKYVAALLLTLLALSLAGTEKAMAHGGTSVSFQTFYDELSPYGRWINYPGHGYVWAPDVEADFQPYATRGHWVITEYGNTWVSDYAWGWAPFHYGRWLWDDYLGWVWVPGTEWGPAWVNWRSGADYYGWAPLGPGMQINIIVNIPVAHWVFVPRRHLMSRRIYNYCVPVTTVVNVYHNTTIINNYYRNDNRTYVYGPRVQEIEQHTRSRVPVYRVNQDSRPGRAVVDRGSVRMYRPDVADQRNEAPARVVGRENVTRPERGSMPGNTSQTRNDRSSYTRSRENTAGTGNTQGNVSTPRERFTESRSSLAVEGNTAGRNGIVREGYRERSNSSGRSEASEGTTNIPGTDFSRPRESARRSVIFPEREAESTNPVQERGVRARPARTPVPAERPAVSEPPLLREAPVRRELPQPDRNQYNPGTRQEQPAVRQAPRSAESAQPVRPQSSQPQYEQQHSRQQQQRPERTQSQPQRHESAPDGVPTRRSRSF